MLSYFQAIILGLLQGVTELFPISSLGHSVILPKLIGWEIDQKDNYFLIFLVATHLATATVLFFFFLKDWTNIFKGLIRSLKDREIKNSDADAKLGWLLIVGTVPAGVLGLLFEDHLRTFFASPNFVAIFLTLNGILLFGAEILRRRSTISINKNNLNLDQQISKLTWMKTIKVGFMQSIALLPGFSRTGATIAGGLLVGLSHDGAVRFSFLLATPIIGAAALLKLPELLMESHNQPIGPILVGSFSSALAAYFSVKFLTKYFHHNTLKPFAIYCFMVGILVSLKFLSS